MKHRLHQDAPCLIALQEHRYVGLKVCIAKL